MPWDLSPTLSSPPMVDQFFGAEAQYDYEAAIQKTVRYLQDFLNRDDFYSGASPASLRTPTEKISVDTAFSGSLDQALADIKEVFLDHAVAYHHPRYVAHLNCPVLLPALVGDLIASSVNTAVETWDQSTSATLIEQEVIRWICREMGLPSSSDGVFTSGGTQSNLEAILMARDHYAFTHYGINLKEHGWSDEVSRFRIFCSDQAHFSIRKNAALLGLGYGAVVPVATDHRMKMRPEALRQAIEQERQRGNVPIMIVATAGTTDYGSFDPLLPIADLAQHYDAWFHVDGAYGGCYVLSETHRPLLRGIERAHSVTVDFHKTLFQPLCASALLVSDTTRFRYVSYYADYLNPQDQRDETCPNLIEKSLQTTRRFDALKVWFTLKVTGPEVLGQWLEKVHALALSVYHHIRRDGCFEVAHRPELSTLVFRFRIPGITPEARLDDINQCIRQRLFASGRASVASTRLRGSTYLKFTLLTPQTTPEDLRQITEMIKEEGLACL